MEEAESTNVSITATQSINNFEQVCSYFPFSHSISSERGSVTTSQHWPSLGPWNSHGRQWGNGAEWHAVSYSFSWPECGLLTVWRGFLFSHLCISGTCMLKVYIKGFQDTTGKEKPCITSTSIFDPSQSLILLQRFHICIKKAFLSRFLKRKSRRNQ